MQQKLTKPQYRVLKCLDKHGRLLQHQAFHDFEQTSLSLADHEGNDLGITKATFQALLDRGFIESINPPSLHCFEYDLTEEGLKALEAGGQAR